MHVCVVEVRSQEKRGYVGKGETGELGKTPGAGRGSLEALGTDSHPQTLMHSGRDPRGYLER